MTRRILLVEDEDDIREVAQACLELTRGWEVHTASNGIKGLQSALELQPDAILLDVMMPELDGPGTLVELKQNAATQEIPVIFLTAKVHSAERARFMELGARGVLAKPFDPMKLGDDVAEILGWTE
jgi:two-component system alkaline phosphatase synthesis response regulator PhoP